MLVFTISVPCGNEVVTREIELPVDITKENVELFFYRLGGFLELAQCSMQAIMSMEPTGSDPEKEAYFQKYGHIMPEDEQRLALTKD